MVVYVKMNDKIIATFHGSKQLNLSAQEEANLYLASLQKVFPEAKIQN